MHNTVAAQQINATTEINNHNWYTVMWWGMKMFMKLFTQYSYKSIEDPIAVLGYKSES